MRRRNLKALPGLAAASFSTHHRFIALAISGLVLMIGGHGSALAQEIRATSQGTDVTLAAPLRVLDLAQAEALYRDRSRDLALAHSAVVSSRAGVTQASARPNPTLSWNGQNIQAARTGPLQKLDATIAFSNTWERGGKRALRIAQAEAQLGSVRADEADTLRQGLQGLRSAWFDLLQAEQREQLTARTVQTYERSLAAALKRQAAGDLAGAEVARLRVEAERASIDANAAAADRRRARISLASLLALEAEATQLSTDGKWPIGPIGPNAPSGPSAAEPAPALVGAELEARIDSRADVRSARLAAEAAERAIAVVTAQRQRDLTWTFSGERDRGNNLGTTVGLGVSVPLLLGNNYEGDITRAQAELGIAQQRLDKARAQALSDIQQAQSDLDAARAALMRLDNSLVPAAMKSTESAEFAYSRGALGLMDLLDARRTLQAVQSDALQARATYAQAWAAREAALGTDSLP